MNRKSLTLAMVTLLLLFVPMRINAAFQNEKNAAILHAKQLNTRADFEMASAAEDDRKMQCGLAWGRYRLAEVNAKSVLLAQGEVGYLKARAKLLSLEPICGSEVNLHESFELTEDSLNHLANEKRLRVLATSQTQYSNDRRAQGRVILREMWSAVSGAKF